MNATPAAVPSAADAGSPRVTRKQLARLHAVSLRTVDEWMARGWIPYFKIGGAIRFHAPDVDNALRERFEVRAKPSRGAKPTASQSLHE